MRNDYMKMLKGVAAETGQVSKEVASRSLGREVVLAVAKGAMGLFLQNNAPASVITAMKAFSEILDASAPAQKAFAMAPATVVRLRPNHKTPSPA